MAREPLRGCTVGGALAEGGGPARTPPREPRPSRAASAPATTQAYAIQPLYVLPQDGADHGLATDGTISRSVAAMQRWFAEKTDGARLRLLSGPVTTVRVGETDAQIAAQVDRVRDRVEELLRYEGYDDPNRLYAVWYDGTSTFSCGGGAWPPDLPGHVAALYLQGHYGSVDCSRDRFSSDGTTVEINEFKMLHEILHTLGLVGRGAPHHTLEGHTSDSPTDLMYAGPPGPPYWDPRVLDVGHDDYYLTGRTDIPDLSRSVFLDPLPAHPTPPPGW
jgi:hypothetical protein